MRQHAARSTQQTACRIQETGHRLQDAGCRRGHAPTPTAHARQRRTNWCGGHSILEYILVAVAVVFAITAVQRKVDEKSTSLLEDTAKGLAVGGLLYGL